MTDRVETIRAYRDALQRRFDQAAHAALEDVPGGEWDGMQVIRRAELERVIHAFAEAPIESAGNIAEVATPGRVFVDAICPRCDIPARVLLLVGAELVVTEDGAKIRVAAKAKPQSHVCGQMPLEPGVDDSDQMRLSDLTGPTEPVLVLAHDVPRPDDVEIDRPAEERCGAEALLPDDEYPEGETIVCERLLDHDQQTFLDDAREHWAEGGFGWHYEERPIPAGAPIDLEDSDEGDDA